MFTAKPYPKDVPICKDKVMLSKRFKKERRMAWKRTKSKKPATKNSLS